MLNAMNTGHEGSLATIHATCATLTRLENMISVSGLTLPPKTMRQQITSAISVVVQAARLTDGRRKIVSIQELTGMEGDIINMQEIHVQAHGRGPRRFGTRPLLRDGVRPKFVERLQAFGINLPDSLYDPSQRYETN